MPEWVKHRERQPDGYIEPGVLKCHCGNFVTIDYDGVACSKCDQEYNLFGQRLMRNWRSEADDYRNEGP
jgi:hypothetical protein